MSARVLITGADGYLGARIARHLGAGSVFTPVAGLRRGVETPEMLQRFERVDVELTDSESLDRACHGIGAVIHLAALNEIESGKDPLEALDVTTGGTVRLLHAAKNAGVKRFLYFSTAHVYGAPLRGCITEEICPKPVHAYAITHKAAEDFVLAPARDFHGIVVRLSNGIGAPAHTSINRWTLIGNDLCRQAVEQQKLTLHSSGKAIRNFIPLSDMCRAVEFLLTAPEEEVEGGLFNLGSSYAMSMLSLAQVIAGRCEKVLGYRPPIECVPSRDEKTDPLDYRSDRLRDAGFVWKATIEEEIDATLLFCHGAFSKNAQCVG